MVQNLFSPSKIKPQMLRINTKMANESLVNNNHIMAPIHNYGKPASPITVLMSIYQQPFQEYSPYCNQSTVSNVYMPTRSISPDLILKYGNSKENKRLNWNDQ
eukprot:NODE_459_length_8196_cov_0.388539.p6 type:complete len:103 gc:universal NODE_459_length_8196_cov_0.388539:6569-6261(-)